MDCGGKRSPAWEHRLVPRPIQGACPHSPVPRRDRPGTMVRSLEFTYDERGSVSFHSLPKFQADREEDSEWPTEEHSDESNDQ